ncbi:tryptophan--tRNA ligase, partial [Candidatus Kaiserbacteria bacterium]|nr:tryptophan--tRNA ligase [Candidatus Kaiserbacteria bacterium]
MSGIRATGGLHFGNLLGAVRHFVDFQKAGNTCLYFVADWHTLTTLKDPDEMRKNLVEIVKDYLAAGLDPATSTIYAQSSVPELAELCLLLSMVQPYGELIRIPTFKELERKHPDNLNFGIVTYPVLMAADILGPRATLVPVGEDQIPNVELARNLAHRFNERFGKTFAVPNMIGDMVKVPGLDGKKMGKSESDNAIDIHSSMEEIADRYRKKGITDPLRGRATDFGHPYRNVDEKAGVDEGCRAVYPLHEMITPGEKDTRTIAKACMAAQISCVDCKTKLVASIAAILEPFQERRRALATQNDYVRDVLHEGGK